MDCNKNIKLHRQRLQLTQQQLADKIGVSRQTVARWENGWNVPTLYYAQKLAAEFSVSVGELMTGEQTEQEKSIPSVYIGHKEATVRYAFLSFAAVFVFALLSSIVSAASRYLSVEGTRRKYDIIFDAVFTAVDSLGYAAIAAVFVFCVLAFYKLWKRTDDMFLRYEIYKSFNIAFVCIAVNALVIMFKGVMSLIALETLMSYATAAFFVAPIDFLFDYSFKKINRNKMVVAGNPALNTLNRVFAAISGCMCVAAVGYLIYYFVMFATNDCGLGLLFSVFFFALCAFGVEVVYVVIRLVLRARDR